MRAMKGFFLITDIGFIIYWLVTFMGWIPKEWAFKDYDDPHIVAWNWSFLPLDLLISATGLTSLHLLKRGNPSWKGIALISLVLTSCSGLQAVAFWAWMKDFDAAWWGFNLYLLLYPFLFIPGLINTKKDIRIV
ncbi:YvaD family protein [Rossellomorea marisflavi]|nr:DUF5360 family protein [Rossellomorea marisflavi]MCM2590058.1 YvaD family protein [Rossellomorea marisflavi]